MEPGPFGLKSAKQFLLLLPIDDAGQEPQVLLEHSVRAFESGRQEQQLFLNLGRQLSQFHDLAQAGPADMPDFGQLAVVLLTSQDVRFYSHTICPVLPFQNKVSFFLTGPKPPLAALVLGRRFHPPERERVAVCPRFAPSGGNGKGGEPESLLPQAESGPVSCRPRV